MKKKGFKKLLSIVLAMMLVFNAVPITALATAYEENTVYITISDDSSFAVDKNGNAIANYPVKLEKLDLIDLAEYGLEHFAYDVDNDGTADVTALHLYIYVHEEVMGLDWSSVTVTGSAGSIYFAGGLFGFIDENLRYDYNGAYPAVDGWGLTADQIVLNEGDFFNVAHYTSWVFWSDSATGFHYFADSKGAITREYQAELGKECTVNVIKSFSDWANGGGTAIVGEPEYTVYYGDSLGGTPAGSVVTDYEGNANITFHTAGTWYVWTDGGYGAENPIDFVSSPAAAKVTVTGSNEPQVDPDKVAADAVVAKIEAIGAVELSEECKTAIAQAREAYDALENNKQKELVTNYETLTAAEAKLAELIKEVEDKQHADKKAAADVDALIGEIGEVTIFNVSKVTKARDAYDDLTSEQAEYVTKLETLTKAEQTLDKLYENASKLDYNGIYTQTAKYLQGLGTPIVGSTGGEWLVIDFTRGGFDCPEGYYKNVEDYVKANINEKGQLHRSKGTDNSRVILALTSAGYDVTDVAGHNLLKGLSDMNYVKKQGINGPIWALIALDSHDYDIPTNDDASAQVTREGLIKYILDNRVDDGGWNLVVSSKVSDPDMTGMAIQALAPYYDTNEEVKKAVDEALITLSNIQHENGGFSSMDGICSESCAQVIVALTSLGIDPEKDERFIKNGVSVVDAMCLFAVEGGGFAHIPNAGFNGMATEQCQYALVAYNRLLNEQTSLYDMSDVQIIKVEKLPAVDATKPVDKVEVGTTEDTKDVLEETSKEILDAVAKDPTKITNVDKAVVEAIKDATEAGKNVVVSIAVKVETIDAKDAEKEFGKTHVALVEEAADKATIAQYLDLSVLMTVQADGTKVAEGEVSKLEKPITFTIAIPETLKKVADGMTRNYFVIRVHGDEVTKIPAKANVDGTLSFETDVFSTYALAYEDVAKSEVPKTETPATGDANNMAMWFALMTVAMAGVVATRRREN